MAAVHIVSADPAAVAASRGLADDEWTQVTAAADLDRLSGTLAFGDDWRDVVGVFTATQFQDEQEDGAPATADASAFIAAAHAAPDLDVELAP